MYNKVGILGTSLSAATDVTWGLEEIGNQEPSLVIQSFTIQPFFSQVSGLPSSLSSLRTQVYLLLGDFRQVFWWWSRKLGSLAHSPNLYKTALKKFNSVLCVSLVPLSDCCKFLWASSHPILTTWTQMGHQPLSACTHTPLGGSAEHQLLSNAARLHDPLGSLEMMLAWELTQVFPDSSFKMHTRISGWVAMKHSWNLLRKCWVGPGIPGL